MNLKRLVLKIACVLFSISYETLIGPQPLRIRFDKIDGFIKTYDENKYLVLRGSEKYDVFTIELDIL